MSLPWVRLDTGLASHPKVLGLLADPSPKRWQAFASYVCALGWCGEHGTDGHIPPTALPFVHGTPATARLLEKHRLWAENGAGWVVPNWAERQPSAAATDAVRAAKQRASRKGNCVRHHETGCRCWESEEGVA